VFSQHTEYLKTKININYDDLWGNILEIYYLNQGFGWEAQREETSRKTRHRWED